MWLGFEIQHEEYLPNKQMELEVPRVPRDGQYVLGRHKIRGLDAHFLELQHIRFLPRQLGPEMYALKRYREHTFYLFFIYS